MKQKLLSKLMLLLLALVAGSASVWAADKTITLDYNSFGLSTSYAEKTATVDGFGFTVNQGYKGSGNVIQMNSSKGSGILYNTTAITGLKSITVNVSSGSKTYTVTTGTSEKPTSNSQTGTSTGTYNAASGDTYFQLKVSGASYFSSIVITYDDAAGSSPSFTASDVNIAYNATGGSIAFTVNNEVDGGTISASTEDDWLTLGGETTSPISFTCSSNESVVSRTATVTLTYTYDTDKTASKNVTVTQVANPALGT
ncbi:MAG: BACON domain-containing protein, partial [Bacteroidaceae bacterium]|nr:BACON domain-containing protein [Bacteroidaceae bacterium]